MDSFIVRLDMESQRPISDVILFTSQSYSNRPFYRYGSHIEIIVFNEYYGMLRGHDHDSIYSHRYQYLRALFGPIILEKDRRAVFGCNSDYLFSEK